MSSDKIRLGLTGSFGSGCGTLMKALEKIDFKGFSLSKYVREKWEKKHGKSSELAPREELQDIGNSLRKRYSNNYLAKKAIKEALKETKGKVNLAFRGIRNIGEVQEFRKTFSDFFLVAVDCATTRRWERVESDYVKLGLTEYNFQADDERDKYEEGIDHGQQVELCVDSADILINNHDNFPNEDIAVDKLKIKIEDYIHLITGEKRRSPWPIESYMNHAYTAASNSKCIKRSVGTVLVDEKNNVILSSGHNEVPQAGITEACIIKYAGRCYRDIYKENYFRELEKKGQTCPKCEEKLEDITYPFHCAKCGFDLDKYFIRDKALNRCRALHAEEKALLNLGSRNSEGLTLYTTTFPCFSCAKKIVDSKIKSVVYVEPYPDEESIEILKEVEIPAIKFEGVKARAYFRLFGGYKKI